MRVEEEPAPERALPPAPPWLTAVIEAGWASSDALSLMGHAYIISSEDRYEAALLGEMIASLKLCAQPVLQRPCQTCLGCRSFLQGSHGDLLEVRREAGKVAIGIDQIRAAVSFLQKTALYGDIKILHVVDADKMTSAAANSLLKTLEEPAGRTLILLSTAEPWRLPATVRSRCQLQRILTPDPDMSLDWLKTSHDWDEVNAASALRLTGGHSVEAWMRRNELDVAIFNELRESFRSICSGTAATAHVPECWTRVEPEFLLRQLLVWCEQNVAYADLPALRIRGSDLLTLHKGIAELWQRVRGGAVPAKDVLVSEVFRLCRSLAHPEFQSIAAQFLATFGRTGGVA